MAMASSSATVPNSWALDLAQLMSIIVVASASVSDSLDLAQFATPGARESGSVLTLGIKMIVSMAGTRPCYNVISEVSLSTANG
jgi:hypothetical protein